jgi:hypothetical protein
MFLKLSAQQSKRSKIYMTQQLANKVLFMMPMNNKICQQARKGHIRSRVLWIAAALIVMIALFASVPAKAQTGLLLATSEDCFD